jgi:choline dehydrogenase-like flavoprotein
MPQVTTGNTHAPTVMIGERASDLIITALGEARPAAALSLNAEEAAL